MGRNYNHQQQSSSAQLPPGRYHKPHKSGSYQQQAPSHNSSRYHYNQQHKEYVHPVQQSQNRPRSNIQQQHSAKGKIIVNHRDTSSSSQYQNSSSNQRQRQSAQSQVSLTSLANLRRKEISKPFKNKTQKLKDNNRKQIVNGKLNQSGKRGYLVVKDQSRNIRMKSHKNPKKLIVVDNKRKRGDKKKVIQNKQNKQNGKTLRLVNAKSKGIKKTNRVNGSKKMNLKGGKSGLKTQEQLDKEMDKYWLRNGETGKVQDALDLELDEYMKQAKTTSTNLQTHQQTKH